MGKAKAKDPEAYLVVCDDGEITGKFGQPLQLTIEQATGLNVSCECCGAHRVIRMVQKGVGRTIHPI